MIMFCQERYSAILSLLATRTRMTIAELEKELSVSPATIRRDLTALEQQGRVVRVHGGILHPDAVRGEMPTVTDQPSPVPEEPNADHSSLARLAASLVPEGGTVFVDACETCLEVGRLLARHRGLTLVTNSMALAHGLQQVQARVLIVGGELKESSRAVLGSLAMEWIRRFRFDYALIGALGLSAREGISTTDINEAVLKHEIMNRTSVNILVADSGKWNRSSTCHFADWNEFDYWCTEGPISQESLADITRHGVKVLHAEPSGRTRESVSTD